MQTATEFLSSINVWLAVASVDGAIGIMIYAAVCTVSLFRYHLAELRGVINGEDYEEEGDFPEDGEDWY